MRKELKKKLSTRSTVFGGWTSLGHPSITEMYGRIPLDFMGIDLEHSTISLEQAQTIILASQARGIPCLPRISSHNAEQIKRILDSGADGLIVPMVSNEKQLADIVSWTKYAPAGKRSFGIARAQGYGHDFDSYVKSWNEESSLIIQIEDKEGVGNIEKLLSNDHVDGVMVGPYDLSGSMGLPGQLDHKDVRAACDKVIEACRKKGKTCGTQLSDPDQPSVEGALKTGFNFIVLASDVFLLWKWGEKMSALVSKNR